MIAACLALHLVGMRAAAPALPARAGQAVRWLAGASFSIYVVHYPVLHLLDALLPEDVPAKTALFILIPLAAGLLFAELFERPLPRLRRRFARRADRAVWR
jgi:peptidoglycan/LPS O-acetylase OafA/YrhL